MKYLFSQGLLLVSSVIILFYLLRIPGFIPLESDSSFNWYNISTVLLLIFVFIEALVALLIYAVMKIFIFGIKGDIDKFLVTKWSVGISLTVLILLFLNLFHFLTLTWGIIIVVLIFLAVMFIR